MSIKSLVAVAALSAAAYAGSATAVPFINGGISFSNGFDSTGTTTSIVSQLVALDLGNTVDLAQGCTGDFATTFTCGPTNAGVAGPFASDFSLAGGSQLVYSINGFTFTVNSFSNLVRTALSCNATSCVDFLSFVGNGTVSHAGFLATAFTMNFSAQGNCSKGAGTNCAGNVTSSWSSSVTALGTSQAPEPATLALLGLGLAGLGFASRRKER